eukprot:TRINITY_DN4706_c0_g1_i5.p1 TRINITY_DN4706_c0_g1~~TRINITY_DN4706_c0_g1_i5.p1  ORF type:complete len:137 (+),score=20.07 TRINITY_DN4706_c0_g1_i5:160-570(+)
MSNKERVVQMQMSVRTWDQRDENQTKDEEGGAHTAANELCKCERCQSEREINATKTNKDEEGDALTEGDELCKCKRYQSEHGINATKPKQKTGKVTHSLKVTPSILQQTSCANAKGVSQNVRSTQRKPTKTRKVTH